MFEDAIFPRSQPQGSHLVACQGCHAAGRALLMECFSRIAACVLTEDTGASGMELLPGRQVVHNAFNCEPEHTIVGLRTKDLLVHFVQRGCLRLGWQLLRALLHRVHVLLFHQLRHSSRCAVGAGPGLQNEEEGVVQPSKEASNPVVQQHLHRAQLAQGLLQPKHGVNIERQRAAPGQPEEDVSEAPVLFHGISLKQPPRPRRLPPQDTRQLPTIEQEHRQREDQSERADASQTVQAQQRHIAGRGHQMVQEETLSKERGGVPDAWKGLAVQAPSHEAAALEVLPQAHHPVAECHAEEDLVVGSEVLEHVLRHAAPAQDQPASAQQAEHAEDLAAAEPPEVGRALPWRSEL
mmetsp:Transcript_8392/g.19827  ORF Transcript_8392/g.19827 Transcript_8392/m.19827 type:complete len:351 (-) Transcript_8392:507-1559(-)